MSSTGTQDSFVQLLQFRRLFSITFQSAIPFGEMISYELRVASCQLCVATVRKLIYELRVTFYELQF